MALTVTNRGTGTHNTSALSFTLSPGSNCTAGATVVLCVACDNADSSGAAHSTFTVTDSLGNTWTRRIGPLYDPGAASAGVEGAIFDTRQDAGTLTTGTTITVTFDANTTAKAWTMHEITAAANKFAGYITGGNNTGAATGTPTVTTGSITNGDAVIGAGFAENTNSWAGDADTTNGSWSTQQSNGVGSTTSAISITSQAKVVNATATQTYNPTRTSSDCILGWVQYRELNAYSLTCDGTSFTLTGVATLFDRTMVADTAAFTLTGNDHLRKLTFICGTGAVTLTGPPVTLTHGGGLNNYTLTCETVSFALTGPATALLRGARVMGEIGYFGLRAAAPTTAFTDNFNRANEDLDAGANWEKADTDVASLPIIGNLVGGNSYQAGAVYSGSVGGNNQWAEVTFAGIGSGDAADHVGILLRCTGDQTTFSGYAFTVARRNTTADLYSDNVRFASHTNTATFDNARQQGTTLATNRIKPFSNGGATTIRAEIIGTTFFGYVDGVLVLVADTQGTYTSGKVGIFSFDGTLDDFSCGTFNDTASVRAQRRLEALQTRFGFIGNTGRTTDFSDNFNRADESLNASSNWWKADTDLSSLQIVGNKVEANSVTGAGAVYSGAVGNDQWAQVTLSGLTTSAGTGGGLILRGTGNGASFTGYTFTVQRSTLAAGYDVAWFRNVQSEANFNDPLSQGSGLGGFYINELAEGGSITLRAEIIGDVLYGYVNGVLVWVANGLGAISSGQPGFVVDTCDVDDFSCGTITGPSLLAGRRLTCEYAQNLFTYSEDFTGAGWLKSQSSIVADAAVAPDGTTTMDKLVEDTSNGQHRISGSAFTGAGQVTFSIYAKAAERSQIQMRIYGDAGAIACNVNLSTGTLVQPAYIAFGSLQWWSSPTASVEDVGNGVYRCTLSGIFTSGASTTGLVLLHNGSTDFYTGDGTSGVYLWGAQFERAPATAGVYKKTVATAISGSKFSAGFIRNFWSLRRSHGTGSFSLTGGDAALLAGRRLTCDATTYTLTGVDVALTFNPGTNNYTLTCNVAAFNLASGALGLLRGLRVPLTAQAFTLTGPPTELLRGLRLACDAQAFTLSGQAASTLRGARVAADAASFTLTGTATGLVLYDSAQIAISLSNSGSYTLPCASASFALTGNATNVLAQRRLTHDAQAFTLTGQPNQLLAQRRLSGDQQTFALTGLSQGLIAARRLNAAPNQAFALTGVANGFVKLSRLNAAPNQVFTLTGVNTALIKTGAAVLAATTATFTLTGVAAGIRADHRLTCSAGAFTATGNATGLNRGRTLACSTATYALTGVATNLNRGLRLPITVGTQALVGNAVNLVAQRRLVADVRTYALSGVVANLVAQRRLVADVRTYVLGAYATGLDYNGTDPVLSANTGVFALATSQANFVRAIRLGLDTRAFAFTGIATGLNRGLRFNAGPNQSFASTLRDANLLRGLRLPADVRAYTLALVANNFLRGLRLPADSAVYALYAYPAGLNYTAGFYIGSVDSDNAIYDGQENVLIYAKAGQPLWAASGNRVTIEQGGVRRNQIVTSESTTVIAITADLTGFTIPGALRLYVHRPR